MFNCIWTYSASRIRSLKIEKYVFRANVVGVSYPLKTNSTSLVRIQAKMLVYSVAFSLSLFHARSEIKVSRRITAWQFLLDGGLGMEKKFSLLKLFFDLPPHRPGRTGWSLLCLQIWFCSFGNLSVLVSFTFWTVSKEGEEERKQRGQLPFGLREAQGDFFRCCCHRENKNILCSKPCGGEREKRAESTERKRDPTPIWKFTDEKIYIWINGSVSIFL